MQGEHRFYTYACESREDEDIEPPFAVVGSNVSINKEDGKVVRGREYPWGVVDIENKVRALHFPYFYTPRTTVILPQYKTCFGVKTLRTFLSQLTR